MTEGGVPHAVFVSASPDDVLEIEAIPNFTFEDNEGNFVEKVSLETLLLC